MKNHHGTDERIHLAQLVIVPATNAGWGYGLYLHPSMSAEVLKKAADQFTALKTGNPLLLKALDLGSKYEFATQSEAAVQAMKKSLATAP